MSGKLTTEQETMLTSCVSLGAAWITGIGGDNEALLKEWAAKGWARKAESPAGSRTLVAYYITDKGRAALLHEGQG